MVSVHNGPFNNSVDNMRGEGDQKMSVFVHAEGIKTVHPGGGSKKDKNSVHIVDEWPLIKEKFQPIH